MVGFSWSHVSFQGGVTLVSIWDAPLPSYEKLAGFPTRGEFFFSLQDVNHRTKTHHRGKKTRVPDTFRTGILISWFTGWWLNQPLWKICSSNWVHLPQFSGEHKKCLSCHHRVYELIPTKRGSTISSPLNKKPKQPTVGSLFSLPK